MESVTERREVAEREEERSDQILKANALWAELSELSEDVLLECMPTKLLRRCAGFKLDSEDPALRYPYATHFKSKKRVDGFSADTRGRITSPVCRGYLDGPEKFCKECASVRSIIGFKAISERMDDRELHQKGINNLYLSHTQTQMRIKTKDDTIHSLRL